MAIERVNQSTNKLKKAGRPIRYSYELICHKLILVNYSGINASSTFNISGESRNCRVGRDGYGVGKLYTSFVYKLRPGTFINIASAQFGEVIRFTSPAKEPVVGKKNRLVFIVYPMVFSYNLHY